MMVQEGVMENPKVDAIFGLHASSAYPAGWLAWRSGPAMSAADQFWIDVTGKQTHGARPWSGIDPIVVSSQIILGLQTIPSRQINSMLEPAVITVGAIHGGNRMNIVPDNVAMTGTIRTYDEGMKKDIHQRIARTADMIAQSAGAKADVRVVELYNATVNPPALTEKMGPRCAAWPAKATTACSPIHRVGGLLVLPAEGAGPVFYLGVTPKGTDVDKAAPNHSPRFYVDESGLINGVRALSNLTVDYMLQARQGS